MPLADGPAAGAAKLPPLLVAAPPIRCCAHAVQIPLYISSLSLRTFVSLACTSRRSHPVTCTAWRRQVVTEQQRPSRQPCNRQPPGLPSVRPVAVRMSAAQPDIAEESRHINQQGVSHHIESNGRVVLEWQSIRGSIQLEVRYAHRFVRHARERGGMAPTRRRGTARSADETWMEKFGALGKI